MSVIGSLSLIRLRAKTEMYKQFVKIRYPANTEIINLEYERGDEPNSEEELTSGSDEDSLDSKGEKEDEFVLTLSDA